MKYKRQPILATLFLVCWVIFILSFSQASPLLQAQSDLSEAAARAEAVFQQLSPQDRVGQLFMVTFDGLDVTEASHIAILIRDYRVGGIWLQASNKPEIINDALEIQTLINSLQTYTLQPTPIITTQTSITTTGSSRFETIRPATALFSSVLTTDTNDLASSIPLFIAVDHEGNGYPYTLLAPELVNIPGAMALGATWHPQNSEDVGQVIGQGLSALGVNMLFGPVLDVIDQPRPDVNGAIGVRSFGGHFYWVGEMGQAYIRGVHLGSKNQLLAIAKHFPGAGSIDRRLNQEVPTVQRTIEDLQAVELAPFHAVTSQAIDNLAKADGLMTAHVRYKGLQENIREGTQPLSLDAQNLPDLLNSPGIGPWREDGGLIVSGPLGALAIHKTYVTEDGDFLAKQVVRNAFLAGNDLLLLSNFGPSDNPAEQFENITAVIDFFQDSYETDPDFQRRVDEAVRRILQAKFRLYPEFTLDKVIRNPNDLLNLPDQTETLTRIARESVTLLAPGPAELADRIPSPPLPDEKILIFADDRQDRLCATCDTFYLLDPFALQETIIKRYGPGAGNQIGIDQVFSFTFSDLANALANNNKTLISNLQVNTQLEEADWVIFSMLDTDDQISGSNIVKRFLQDQTYDLRDKKIIVFAFDAPYYLDETEVSFLTAYYGFYNRTEPYIDLAARLLFKEFQAQGHAPVSVDAVGYKLEQIVKPNPTQMISLSVVTETQTLDEHKLSSASVPIIAGTPIAIGEETIIPISGGIGDQFRIQTGMIVDHNGHPVPDGTRISFNQRYMDENLDLAPITMPTVDGVATLNIVIERLGTVEITAASDAAQNSQTIVIEGTEQQAVRQIITDTTMTKSAPAIDSANTAVVSSSIASTEKEIETSNSSQLRQHHKPLLNMLDLLYSSSALIIFTGLFFLSLKPLNMTIEVQLWFLLVSFITGLVGYILYGILAVQLATVVPWRYWIEANTKSHMVTPAISLLFALLGTGLGFSVLGIQEKKKM